MKKYKVLNYDSCPASAIEEALNEYSKNGWELFSLIPNNRGPSFVVVLVRSSVGSKIEYTSDLKSRIV